MSLSSRCMYNEIMKRVWWSPRWPFIVLSFIALLLSIFLIALLGFLSYGSATSIVVAAVVAVTGWFIGSILKARLDVEAKVHQDITEAITSYTDTLTSLRTAICYEYPPEAELVIKYKDNPEQLWAVHTLNQHQKATVAVIEVLNAQKKFRDVIEANELVAYKLQDMYRFIMLHNDGILAELRKVDGDFIGNLTKIKTHDDYKKVVEDHKVIGSLLWDQQGFCTDLKYALNNLVYSKIFFVKMPKRITTDGSDTLYDLDLKKEIAKYQNGKETEKNKKRYEEIMSFVD